MLLAAYAIQKSCFGVSGVSGVLVGSTPDTQTEYFNMYIFIYTSAFVGNNIDNKQQNSRSSSS